MRPWLISILLFACLNTCWAQAPDTIIRIRDAAARPGERVTVQGRTGVIRETLETAGVRVFTLRDDYGDEILVRAARAKFPEFHNGYPIMGVTYTVTGTAGRNTRTGHAYITAETITRSYPQGGVGWKQIALISAAGLAAVVLVAFLVARRAAPRGAAAAMAAPVWGYLEIMSSPGQDVGTSFPLREDTVMIGREVPPDKGVRLALDKTVSAQHGEIIHDGGRFYYQDLGSKNGSRIKGIPVNANELVPLLPGALIGLGKNRTMLRFNTTDAPFAAGTAGQTVTMDVAGTHAEAETIRMQD